MGLGGRWGVISSSLAVRFPVSLEGISLALSSATGSDKLLPVEMSRRFCAALSTITAKEEVLIRLSLGLMCFSKKN